MSLKHFIALVKMDGDHEGKIGQHSTMQNDTESAVNWGKNRFSRPFAIVELSNPEKLSLQTQEAEDMYKNSVLHQPISE